MTDQNRPADATETFRLDPNDRPITGAVGKYELYELLGAGSMGAVYRAVDPKLGREVAIKLMTPAVASDPDLRDRFHREAQTAGALQHPNIITIFEFGEVDDRLFIAMEYVEGRDLSRIIRTHEAMSLLDKLGIALDVLAGLEYAHGHGVTHRDIKPGNIRLTSDGRAKIMDFGIAHLAESDLTGTGMVLGTPSYMAPESLKGDPPSPLGDVYSVGAVLYELIAFRKPFEGSTQQEVLYRVLSDTPTSLGDVDPTVPVHVEDIVRRAMAKDPADRYQSTTELSDDLKASCVAMHQDSGATLVRPIRRRMFPRPEIRWSWTLAAAAGVIVVSWGASRLVSDDDASLGTPAEAAVTAADLSTPTEDVAPNSAPATTPGDTLLVALRDAALARRIEVESAGVPAAQLTPGDDRLLAADSLARMGRLSEAVLALSNATSVWDQSEREYRAAQTRPPPRRRRTTPTRVTRSEPQAVQPSTPTAAPPRTPARDDPAEISTVVVQLTNALESRSVARVKGVYPGLTEREAATWDRFFQSAVDLQLDLQLSELKSLGDSATALIQGSYTYRNEDGVQRQPLAFPAAFVRREGRWVIRHLGSTGS